ncbi:MAG: methyltransferase [Nocardioides sp.]
MQTPSTPDDQARDLVMDLVRGAWRSLAARAMASLRIADALATPATADEVAHRTGTDPATLDRLLRTLAAIGLLTYRHGTYELTEAGARLRSDVPGSDWGALMHMAGSWTLSTWQALPDAVRSGERVFDRVHGEPFWDYLRSHPEAGQLFDAAMARDARDRDSVRLVVDELSDASVETLVDVGGGTGRLLAQVVAARPGLRGVLADQEGPVHGSAEVFAHFDVTDRCEAVVSDFFAGVPAGGDAYLLSNILHDWEDEACRKILGRIREASTPGTRLLLLETVLPDEEDGVRPDSAQHHLLDLMMLINFGGRERRLDEYSDLLEASGFGEVRLAGGRGPHLVVATRV